MGINPTIFGIGILFLILAYFIGIKKQTWLLSGFNQHRVRNKEKLSKITGTADFVTGLLLIIISFFASQEFIGLVIQLAVFAHLAILVFVNVKMVDK